MADGVLLDTSFLICFADPAQRNHETARRYLDFFVEEGVLMYLSTIVASEFHLGQPVHDLPLDAFQVLPFSLHAAIAAADLEKKRVPDPDPKTPRAALKDDMKLLGQAKVAMIAYVITDDESSLYKWCERLRQAHAIETRAIKLSGGFQRSHSIRRASIISNSTPGHPVNQRPRRRISARPAEVERTSHVCRPRVQAPLLPAICQRGREVDLRHHAPV